MNTEKQIVTLFIKIDDSWIPHGNYFTDNLTQLVHAVQLLTTNPQVQDFMVMEKQ